MTRAERRQSGIVGLGEVSWGTHFCHFHETARDLLETGAGYLGAGLESDESCIWLIPEPLTVEDGWAALGGVVHGLDRHREAGHIHLSPSRTWYYSNGKLDLDAVMAGWSERLAAALAAGREGLRVCGSLSSLIPCEWDETNNLERVMNEWISDRRMLAMCNYVLELTTAAEVVDLMSVHHCAVCSREGRREMVESRALRAAKFQIGSLADALEDRVADRTRELEVVNSELTREIASRRRAEEALLNRERQFSTLFHQAVVGIGLFGPDCRIEASNRSLQRMLGYAAEELAAMDVAQLLDAIVMPGRVTATRQCLAELLDGAREHYTVEDRYCRKDRSVIWGRVTLSAVRDGGGQALLGIAMFEDITERKRAEDALRRAHADLAHANRMLTMGVLVASIAHEVSQPLAAIHTNGQAGLRWLSRLSPDLDEARTAVERIVRDSGRTREVIHRISALVKKSQPRKTPLEVNEVIHEVVTITEREVEKARVTLRTELAEDLPAVPGDRVQLQQVLLNLIVNAVDAVNAGRGPLRELVISSSAEPAAVRVAVRDSGVGLEPGSEDRLFAAFFTTKEAGMGMGLSISRSIIEAHGGLLSASANGDAPGATFTFTLPIQDDDGAPAPT